jgi:NADH pyrophosphatase NudC (nudix superfamily)
MLKRCPGAKELVEPRITIRTCPACGEEVEFLSYETEAKCYNCGRMLHREATPSCVVWCEYAEKCIADLRGRELITPSRAEELREIAKAAKDRKLKK